MHKQIEGELFDRLANQLRDLIDEEVSDQLEGRLWIQLMHLLYNRLGSKLLDQLRECPQDE